MTQPRRILVTGAASGMGAATADLLLREGVDVVLLDRVAEPLRELVRQRGRGTVVEIDLMDRRAIEDGLADLELDGVANVAGLGPDHPSAADVVRVNLLAPFLVMDAVRGRLRPGASIVNVASMIAHVADDRYDAVLSNPLADGFVERACEVLKDGASAYTYSKRTVRRLSERMAVEWAPDVRINAVSPGIINTPMTKRGVASDEWTRRTVERIPMGRMGEPSEVAAAIGFLLGPAASYITGVTLPLDGGALASRMRYLEDRARRKGDGA